MLKSKTYIFHSSLSVAENQSLLETITEKFHTASSDKFKFEGKINSDSFHILPTLNYVGNNKFRPELLGTIKEQAHGIEVKLKFQIPIAMRVLIISGFIVIPCLVLTMLIFPDLTDAPLWDNWWIGIIWLVLSYVFFRLFYESKVSESIKILKSVLKLSEV